MKFGVQIRSDERGQTMTEYGVVLGLITLAVVTTIAAISGNIVSILNRVVAALS